jgi:hypothetical protein
MLAAHTFLGVTSTEFGQACLGLLMLVIGALIRHKLEKVTVKVTGVEVMVNGRMTQAMARIDQLEQTLIHNGHDVPPSPPPPLEVLVPPAT